MQRLLHLSQQHTFLTCENECDFRHSELVVIVCVTEAAHSHFHLTPPSLQIVPRLLGDFVEPEGLKSLTSSFSGDSIEIKNLTFKLQVRAFAQSIRYLL